MLFTTTDGIDGKTIKTYFPTQLVAETKAIISDINISASFEKCKYRLIEVAEKLFNADAVVAVRTNVTDGRVLTVSMYGTPVIFE